MQKQREIDFNNELSLPVLALCLSSRTSLCIEKEVKKEEDAQKLESLCRGKTANWLDFNNQSLPEVGDMNTGEVIDN